mgnify:CR=1 FL=1
MRTFLQHVNDTLTEARKAALADSPDLDAGSLKSHLESAARRAGIEWWKSLTDAAYRGESVPLAAWRSALREHQSSARGLLGRWIRARPSGCPDALKAAAMAQEFGKQ